MTHRRAQTWVWWLLPILVARALLPIGFMPSAGADSLRLVMCSAGFIKAIETAPQTEHPSAAAHFTCPFAQLGTLGVSLAAPVMAGALLIAALLAFPHRAPLKLKRRTRFTLARGPPARA